jgi:hypothetical protein
MTLPDFAIAKACLILISTLAIPVYLMRVAMKITSVKSGPCGSSSSRGFQAKQIMEQEIKPVLEPSETFRMLLKLTVLGCA